MQNAPHKIHRRPKGRLGIAVALSLAFLDFAPAADSYDGGQPVKS